MIIVTAEEVQEKLPEYLVRVATGETVVITRADQPVAELTASQHSPESARPYGLCAGEFVVPDDFDAPLPEELLADFEAG